MTYPEKRGDIGLDQRWMLNEQVSVRTERFGGLLYHFGTRRLSFVKAPDLLEVVQRLADCANVAQALDAAAVGPERRPAIIAALRSLAAGDMIRRRAGDVDGAAGPDDNEPGRQPKESDHATG